MLPCLSWDSLTGFDRGWEGQAGAATSQIPAYSFCFPFSPHMTSSARLPVPGPEVPRAGGPLARFVGRLTLRLLGFRVEGDLPNQAKFVVIAAPHTSNWDFPIAMGAKLALALDATWLGKDSLFRFPFGAVLRWLGGIPVNRSASHDVVGQMKAEFAKRPRMVLALAPEGTRKRVERWRTGFYHIAHAAGVPIVPVALDWEHRAIRIMPPFSPTGDADRDVEALRALFDGVSGRRR